jgi:hypothetical protein
MSTVVSKNVQIGADGTASNNFTIYQPASPDGTLRIGNGNTGTTSAQVVLTSAGNVGIGTSSPARKLDVSGAGVFNFTSGSIEIAEPGTVPGFVLQTSTANQRTDIRNTAGNLVFTTGTGSTTERMRIDSSGNVGIGTISPDANLTVNGAASFAAGTALLPSITRAGDLNTGIFFPAADSIAFSEGGVEALRIMSDNCIALGTTSNVFSARQSIQFSAAGSDLKGLSVRGMGASGQVFVEFVNSGGGGTGSITQSGAGTAYNTSSDYRLKHDIRPMTGALAKVAQLKPVTYKWNADDSEDEGFIAHELAEVCPSAVSGEKDAVNEDGSIKPQGIDTSFLVATLTAAIQELKAELDAVKTQLSTPSA